MKTYLGDSVYAEYDNAQVESGPDVLTLTTENGEGPTNTIYLESEVFENLILFVNKIREQFGAKPIAIPKWEENE